MTRRRFLQATGAVPVAASAGFVSEAASGAAQTGDLWQPSPRYPDPRVRVLDPSFVPYRLSLAKVERIATGMRWAEGPVWFGDGRYLLWSDIPNDRIMRWDEATGVVATFRQPAGNSNGLARDRQGRLLTCEHLNRRVTRTEYDGSLTVIADRHNGTRLNSPNDVVCRSDGAIWFTDPPFGILGYYEGERATPELPTNVYRWDPATRALDVVAGDVNRPNGLAFSPDEQTLYVIEAGSTPRRIRAYSVTDGGRSLSNGRILVATGEGETPDGLRVDVDGNLWCGWGMGVDGLDGVRVINPQGRAIGHIDLPERCANVCFGGRHRNRLFMCASTSVYALDVNTQGAT
jgi:gluconolactonase